jgi:hypothetical protein
MMQKREKVLLDKWEDQIRTNKTQIEVELYTEQKRQSIKEALELRNDSKIKRGYIKYQQQKEQVEEFLTRKKECETFKKRKLYDSSGVISSKANF